MNAVLRVTSTTIAENNKVQVNYQMNHAGEMSIEGYIFIDGNQYMDMTPKMVRAYIANDLIQRATIEKQYWESLSKK